MRNCTDAELITYLEGLDTDAVIELLDINSVEIVSAFTDLVLERRDQILKYIEENEEDGFE